MKPAASVIFFTTFSGAGLGMLVFLALGLPPLFGWPAFRAYFLAYALSVGGLMASVLHLARPARARFALSQWASSWLSREGVVAIVALLVVAPVAVGQIFLSRHWLPLGIVAAALCLLTVLCTAMIYASLRSVPRWNMGWTPALYLTQALAGGAVLTGQGRVAAVLLIVLGAVQVAVWLRGDRRFAEVGATLAGATGQPDSAALRLFERSHTARDWVMQEFAYRVARKHAEKLRIIGFGLLVVLPALLLLIAPASLAVTVLAAVLHLAGGLTCRWLFFGEAEHGVSLYYGV